MAKSSDELVIELAQACDIDDVTYLLRVNSPASGGTLTGSFPHDRVAGWIRGPMPVVIARLRGELTGVLVTSPMDQPRDKSVLGRMCSAYHGGPTAYIYGPVCIDARSRGSGLLARLWAEARRQLPDREAVLFIRLDNIASVRAHARLGMRQVATFEFDGAAFGVFSSLSGVGADGDT